MGKFVRRHRVAVAASLALALSLLGFGVGMGLLALEVSRERDRAEVERSRAEQVTAFLTDVLCEREASAEAEGLARGALASLQGMEGAVEWEVAHAESVLGGCLSGLGRHDEAEAILLQAYATLDRLRGAAAPPTQEGLKRLVAHYEARGRAQQAAAYRFRRKRAQVTAD